MRKIWIIVIALMLLVSCTDEIVKHPVEVRLSIAQDKALTVTDQAEITQYKYKATNLSSDEHAVGATDGFKALGTDSSNPLPIGLLSQGLWHFDVQGLNKNGVVIATGSAEQYLNAGSDNIVPILLVTDKTIGKGKLSFKIASDATDDSKMALLVRHRAVGETEYKSQSTGWTITYSTNKAEVEITGKIEGLASGFHEVHFILMDNGVYIGGESVVAQIVSSDETKIEGIVLPSVQKDTTLDIVSPGFINGSIGEDVQIHVDETATFTWVDAENATVSPTSFVWAIDGAFQKETGSSLTFTGVDYGENQICVLALKTVDGKEREIGSATAKINVVRRLADITFDAKEGYFSDGSQKKTISQDTYEDPKVPDIPYRTGYKFAGWYKGTTRVVDANNNIDTQNFRGEGSWILEAHWDKMEYNITVVWGEDVDGRPTQETKAISLGDKLSSYISDSVTRDGYAFGGFWTEQNGVGTKVTANDAYSWTNDMTLYAWWSYKDIVVSFLLDKGASVYKTITVAKDLPYGLLPNPMRQGMVFKGWVSQTSYISNENAPRVTADTIVTNSKAHTLWATWGEGDIVVTFDTALSSTELASAKTIVKNAHGSTLRVALGTEYGTLPFDGESKTSLRTGYEFIGWYDGDLPVMAKSAVMKMENHTLTAKWRGIEVNVSFDSQGGSPCTAQTVRFGSSYGDLPTPTKIGYKFLGWYYNNSLVTSSTTVSVSTAHTLTARWEAVEVKVTFEAEGGTVSPENGYVSYNQKYSTTRSSGKVVGLPTPAKTGYIFQGWALTSTDTTYVTKDTVNTSYVDHYLYAIYKPTTATLSFIRNYNSSDNTVLLSRTVTYNSAYGSLLEPERTGYAFLGWYTQREGGVRVTSATLHQTVGNVNIYARWSVLELDITMDPNGGTYSGTNPIQRTYGSVYGALTSPDARTGYNFVTWMLDDSAVSKTTVVTKTVDHILKAKWQAKTYTLSYDSKGGSSCTSKTVTFDAIYGELPTPTREGYTFTGWYAEESYTTPIQSGTKVTTASNHTLYAKWQAKPISITYDWETGSRTNILEYGSTYAGTFPTPEREGYGIEGWYYDSSYKNKASETDSILSYDHTIYAKWIQVSYCYHLHSHEDTTRHWKRDEIAGSGYVSASGTIGDFSVAMFRRASGIVTRWQGSASATFTQDITQEIGIYAQAGSKTYSGVFTCRTCGGDGGWTGTCSTCKGTGSRSCPSCGGSGRVTCSICNGSGTTTETYEVEEEYTYTEEVEDGTQAVRCSSCSSATGKRDTDCPLCGGRGGYYVPKYKTVTKTGTRTVTKTRTVSCPETQICGRCDGGGSVSCSKTQWYVCSKCSGSKKATYYSTQKATVKIIIDGTTIIETSDSASETVTVKNGSKYTITTTTVSAPEGYPTLYSNNYDNYWCVQDKGYNNSYETLIALDGSYISLDDKQYRTDNINLVVGENQYTNASMNGYYYYPGWIYKDTVINGAVTKTEKVSSGSILGNGTVNKVDNDGTVRSDTITGVNWTSSEVTSLGAYVIQWQSSEPARGFDLEFTK